MFRKFKFQKAITSGRLIIISFLVLAALIMVVGVGLATPKDGVKQRISNSTIQLLPSAMPTESNQIGLPSSWNKYQDSQFGFEISYPNNWVVEDKTNRVKEKDPLRVLFFRPRVTPSRLMRVEGEELRQRLSIVAVLMVYPEQFDTEVEKISSYTMSNVSKQEISVRDISGIKIEGESIVWDQLKNQSTTEHRVVVVLPSGNNTITFSFAPYPLNMGEDYSALLPLFLQSFVIR